MNPIFIKSLEKILLKYMEYKIHGSDHSDKYALCRLETDNLIIYTYHYIQPKASEIVTIKEMMKDYDEYFTDSLSKQVSFKIDSKSKRKAIVKLLIKSELPLSQLDKILKALVLNNITKDYADILRYCCENKTKYSQEVAFKTMNYMGQMANYNSVKTECFTESLQLLQEYIFTPGQYPSIHNFFKHHDAVITNKNEVVALSIVNFLKYSIKAEDWHLFEKYCYDHDGLKPLEKVAANLFEDNNKFVYNIIINPSYVKARHPYLSLDNDMKHMIEHVLDTFTRKGRYLRVEHGFSSFINKEKIGLHFMSLDTEHLNGERIRKIFDTLIDKYVETHQAKKRVSDTDMNHAFDYAFLESITPLKEEKNKTHKI